MPVEPQAFRLLAFLVENQDRMVSRDELTQHLWDGRAVSDWALSAAVKSARRAIGDTEKTKRYIRTVHAKGFRFVGGASGGSGAYAGTRGRLSANGSRVSLAVLPFANLTGNAERDYIADGLSEDLIIDLANIPELLVASRNACFAVKDQASDLLAIAERLGVGHVLEGSVRLWGDAVRINARLIEAATGEQRWAKRFDGAHADIFALQDDIRARIVASLAPHLTPTRGRRPTRNAEAYDLCLQGRSEYYRYTPAHLANALSFFERAVKKDPKYAEPYAYQSYCRCSLHVFAWPGSDQSLEPAQTLAEKAIALDDSSAVAHGRLGWILGFLGRIDDATATFERAIALAPDNAEVFLAYGETMNRLSQPLRALPLIEAGLGIDTFVPPSWQFTKGHSFALLKQFDDALEQFLPVLDRVPSFVPARVQLARTYAEMGRKTEAAETVAALREIAPRYGLKNANRMFPYPDPAHRERLNAALKSAGLPDQ